MCRDMLQCKWKAGSINEKNLVYLLRKGWSQSCRIRSPPARVRQPARFAMPWECLVHRFPSTCLRPMPPFFYIDKLGAYHNAAVFSCFVSLYLCRRDRQPRLRLSFRPYAHPMGPPQAMADARRAASCAMLHPVLQSACQPCGRVGIFLHAADVYPDRHAGFPHQCKLRRSVPGAVSHGGGAGENPMQCAGFFQLMQW